MRITAFKTGKDKGATVKYEAGYSAYTLTTEQEPSGSLYDAANDVAEETKDVMGFKFAVSFSALVLNFGEKPFATIILEAETALPEAAELKCPKISRAQLFDMSANSQVLPGMDANTAPRRYDRYVNLNLAIDTFLKEAEAFVKDVRASEKVPSLFDEAESEDMPE